MTFVRLLFVLALVACGGGGGSPDAGPSLAHCHFEALPPTAGAGGTVEPGPLEAGAAAVPLGLPVGGTMGGYAARGGVLGNAGRVDNRDTDVSGAFVPSVGIETIPMARAVALAAGGEQVVIVKADLIFADDQITHDLAEALGPEYHGKVLFATSHSHSAPCHFSTNSALQVGCGKTHARVRERLLGALKDAAQKAIAARRPAKLGIAVDTSFDPDDLVTHDRREQNDGLAGGKRKDSFLAVLRVDGVDGAPIAVLPVFGVHGTILDADNPLYTTEVTGAIERALEESFDSAVVAIHLQGAGGDVSPGGGAAGIAGPLAGDVASYQFARAEAVGRLARPMIDAVWRQAGAAMQTELAIEMVTRSIELGPRPDTFTIRGGMLAYAPFDRDRVPDRKIFGPGGEVLSPIDEFSAPVGAALCGDRDMPYFPAAELVGVAGLAPYASCMHLDVAGEIFSDILDMEFEAPVCASTRTTISALRLGDWLVATLPGEPVTLLADLVRRKSPVAADKTIVVGYAQGHVGYLLTVEDWLQAGYEPSINFWGPLEGESIVERLAELMPLAFTPVREDAAAGGANRVKLSFIDDDLRALDPDAMAGTVPAAVPDDFYFRGRVPVASAQPEATIPRVTGIARFVWVGEDILAGTPRVTLQRETAPGTWNNVTRRSGRPVQDGDLILTWTPNPRKRSGSTPVNHLWGVEWQAVTPTGTAGMDALTDRAGLPLGRYRFHVEGTGYVLDSQPFEVVAGPLAVTASQAGATLSGTAHYEAPLGWRLLDLEVKSNQKVPIRTIVDVVVEFGDGGANETFTAVPVTSPGQFSVTLPDAGRPVSRVTVRDAFGNFGQATL